MAQQLLIKPLDAPSAAFDPNLAAELKQSVALV
jgi:hypothetical protein